MTSNPSHRLPPQYSSGSSLDSNSTAAPAWAWDINYDGTITPSTLKAQPTLTSPRRVRRASPKVTDEEIAEVAGTIAEEYLKEIDGNPEKYPEWRDEESTLGPPDPVYELQRRLTESLDRGVLARVCQYLNWPIPVPTLTFETGRLDVGLVMDPQATTRLVIDGSVQNTTVGVSIDTATHGPNFGFWGNSPSLT